MTRLYNFCAGPAALPTAVLKQAEAESKGTEANDEDQNTDDADEE